MLLYQKRIYHKWPKVDHHRGVLEFQTSKQSKLQKAWDPSKEECHPRIKVHNLKCSKSSCNNQASLKSSNNNQQKLLNNNFKRYQFPLCNNREEGFLMHLISNQWCLQNNW